MSEERITSEKYLNGDPESLSAEELEYVAGGTAEQHKKGPNKEEETK